MCCRIDEAISKNARNIAAPLNAQRLGVKTPCAIKADKCYDYISVDMMSGVLHRTKTLATGGDCCDFYVCKKGSKWDTTEKNR